MAEIRINRPLIDEAMRQIVTVLAQMPHLPAIESVLALSEAAGRIIVMQVGKGSDPMLHQELHQMAMEHMERTIRSAYQSRGMNPQALNG